MSITATVITKNEEKNIARCLESVAWVDEIIVLDSGSADNTVAICKKYTDKVYETDWVGFGKQKNRALEKASGDWILSLDADEWVTPELKEEIIMTIKNPGNHAAFEMPRLSSFCGQYMRYSGWWPDYVIRLCKKGAARFSDRIVHEKMIVDGSIGRLSNHIMHEPFKDLDQVLIKMNQYSTANAAILFAEGRKSSIMRAVMHGIWTFIETYILRAGFLDGRRGFILAVANAEGTYYKYLKLMLKRSR